MNLKKFFVLMLVALTAITSSCKYDDDELWDTVNSLAERISALETLTKQMNSDIAAMQSIISALEKNVYISEVEKLTDGYILHFTDGTTATIKNGTNGLNGKDAPVINVKQENGVYYWTITVDGETTWLKDDKGNKLPVSGTDGENGTNGKNGVTPLLKIDGDGYWMVSYDNGSSYTYVLDSYGHKVYAVGPQGPAGSDGEDGEDGNDGDKGDIGDSQFTDVEVDEENGTVTITLADGTEIVIPITGVGVTYTTTKNENVDAKAIEIEAGGSVTLKYEVSKMSNATVEVLSEKGVSVSVDESKQEITITEDNDTKTPISEAKVVLLYYNDEQTLTSVLKFKEAWSEDAGDKKVRVNSVYYETIEKALGETTGNITIELAASETAYTIPTTGLSGRTIVIEGTDKENTIIDMSDGTTPQYNATSVTFKNLTMKRKSSSYGGLSHTGEEHYDNCIIEGTLVTYAPVVTVKNTLFDQTGCGPYEYNIHIYGNGDISIENCEFICEGKSIYVHNEKGTSSTDKNEGNKFNITVNKSVFKANKVASDFAAISIHTELGAWGTLTIDGETKATGFDSNLNGGLWHERINNVTPRVATNNFVKTIDGVTYATVSTNEDLEKVLDYDVANLNVELGSDVTVDVTAWKTLAFGSTNTKIISIEGNNKTLTFNLKNSDWSHVATNGAKLVLNNVTLASDGYNTGHWKRNGIHFDCEVEMNNVTTQMVGFKSKATLKNVIINEARGNYSLWIWANGQTVNIDGLTINAGTNDSRAIAIKDEDSDKQKVTLKVSNAKITSAAKAAILVTSTVGADITLSNVDITGVAKDSKNAVWVDEEIEDYEDLVTVTGGSVIVEP